MSFDKIKVIGVPGRVAYTAAQGGENIPRDRPIRVVRDDWIERRLADGDIILFEENKNINAERKTKRLQETNNKTNIQESK